MKILAIETSCDDTGVAVLEAKNDVFKPLANIVSSQQVHQNYGGVFPMMAKREHQRNLIPVLLQALRQSKLLVSNSIELDTKEQRTLEAILNREPQLLQQMVPFLRAHGKPDVDGIAVTQGPGLEPCLWVGVNAARALSYFWNIPLIPVNHIEAHILVNFLSPAVRTAGLKGGVFPAMSLVVSGGHTQLILMKKIGSYKIIGETRDDAAGECFDKCAKMLGLGYPGGPIIAKIASVDARRPRARGRRASTAVELPRPMMHSGNHDFSFSGLKTAALYKIENQKNLFQSSQELWNKFVKKMCRETQQAVVDVLVKKTLDAAQQYRAKTIILGGGVSANQELRRRFKAESRKLNVRLLVPPPKLSTDNALMVAVAAALGKQRKAAWKTLAADANLRIGA